jgi:hypothetical protein
VKAVLGVIAGNNGGRPSTCLAGPEQEAQIKAIIKRKRILGGIAFFQVQASTRIALLALGREWPLFACTVPQAHVGAEKTRSQKNA